MASDATIEFDLIFGNRAKEKLVSDSEKAGKKAGGKAGDGFRSGFSKGVKGAGESLQKLKGPAIAAGVALTAAAVGVAAIAKKGIAAAKVQEEAINDLNSALGRTGQFTQEASQDIQNFASTLQQSSTFGDEAILKNAALIQSLGGLSKEGLKGATQAAADLSSALGIDLTAAATLVGKAAAGEVGSFSRYGVIIKKGATNAETFANTLDALNSKFGGAAASKIQTFEGATTQLSNSFGDALEGVGALITKSPTLIRLVNLAQKGFALLSNKLAEITKVGASDPLKPIINSLFNVAKAINKYVIFPLQQTGKAFFLFKDLAVAAVSRVVANIGKFGKIVGVIISKITGDNSLTSALKNFGETSDKVADENLAKLKSSFENFVDPENMSAKLDETIETLREKSLVAGDVIREGLNPQNTADETANAVAKTGESLTDMFSGLGAGFAATEKQIKDGSVKIAKSAAFVGQNIKKGIGQGIGSGFAAFGAALVNGQNALDAFAKAFLSTLGQMMIQQGSMFILQGLGFSVIPGLQGNGATLIAAGAGLAVAGGALTALGGGGGASPAGGGIATGGGGGSAITSGFVADEEAEREEPETRISLTIQGDVIDSEGSGLRILELLNQELDTSGSVITGLA